MPLILTITPAPGHGRPGDRQIRTMAQGSLSIGRSAGNDWVLADPDQHLSRTHCMLTYDNARCTLTDLSTNGMFINGAREPTSRNSRIVLTDGDSVKLGGYILEVAEADGPAQAPSPGGFASALDDPFGADALGNGGLDTDPLDMPFASSAARGFQHPMATPPPSIRAEDPFDTAHADRNQGHAADDDLFQPRAEQFKGPVQRDNADARAQAFAAPRVIAPVNMGDIDFDDLIGDFAPTQAPHPLSPAAHPAAPPSAPPGAASSPFDDFAFDDLLDAPAAKPAPPPSPPPVMAAASPFDEPDVVSHAAPVPLTMPAPAPAPAAPAPAAPAPVAPTPAGSSATAAALMAAFLDGAGVPSLALPAQDPEAAMRALGALFAAFVTGTREVLMSRAEIKQEMRVERTMLRARDNNALKFSVSPGEAVGALLHPSRPGYKAPMLAVEEAFKDIRSHEMAVMAGMQTAMMSLLARFDPAALESRLQRGMLDSILPGARKARFWELFCTTYKDIAREAADDFHSAFGKQFAEAYDKQVGKL